MGQSGCSRNAVQIAHSKRILGRGRTAGMKREGWRRKGRRGGRKEREGCRRMDKWTEEQKDISREQLRPGRKKG